MPIVKPMAETLGITGQVAVQAFKVGDGMCNVISPFLGWTMGGLAVAKVPSISDAFFYFKPSSRRFFRFFQLRRQSTPRRMATAAWMAAPPARPF